MRLVPRELQRAGMTGNVPYYGGRLTPDQAYSVGHQGGSGPAAEPPPVRKAESTKTPEALMASLEQLRDEGLVTDEEFAELAARVLS